MKNLAIFFLMAASVSALAQTSTPDTPPDPDQDPSSASAAPLAQTSSCSAITLGSLGALNGFVPSPNDAWHQDISNAPVDPSSFRIMNTNGDLGYRWLHPDFSSVVGGNYGIPYTVVDTKTTPAIPVNMLLYPTESDITLYPLTSSQMIEGSPSDCPTDGSDRHAIIIDRNKCVAYEMWQAATCKGNWSASNGAIWDLTATEQRPYGDTSADAAGLSIFEGLLRYDEIVAGSVNHALRFTANHTKNNANGGYFTAPATHASGTNWGADNIIGMRIRLRADFDISHFSQTNQIILKAMKQYGMILADNGADMFFQGTPDPRWNDDDLSALKFIPSSVFEVVQMASPYDSVTAPKGKLPVITGFTASATQVAPGTAVTLTPNVTGASYTYIDKAGFARGAVTVNPTVTTTYTLTAKNAYGAATSSVTVTVSANPTIKSIAVLRTNTSTFSFVAIAKMSDNTTKDVTSTAVWNSSNAGIGTIANGQMIFTAPGATAITAQVGAIASQPVLVQALMQVSYTPIAF